MIRVAKNRNLYACQWHYFALYSAYLVRENESISFEDFVEERLSPYYRYSNLRPKHVLFHYLLRINPYNALFYYKKPIGVYHALSKQATEVFLFNRGELNYTPSSVRFTITPDAINWDKYESFEESLKTRQT